jgi:hypothetical protein
LYEYQTKDINKKAKQNVWSKVLIDLKEKRGESILLLPIAVDTNITSLDILLEHYDIRDFPAVFIGENVTLTEIQSVEGVERFLPPINRA